MRSTNAQETVEPQIDYDAIIVGSGFGGSMVAHTLVSAGLDVLMLERGDWVTRGPDNWADDATIDLTQFATSETPYRALAGAGGPWVGPYSCVGGPSVFYGGVSLRFRPADFERDAEIVGDTHASWPYRYDDLEPYYTQAEQILDVAGDPSGDPTEPPRQGPYTQRSPELSDTSRLIERSAQSLGLHPFRLPLAINYRPGPGACVRCTTCDTFACAIGAKNDLASTVLPALFKSGLRLAPNTIVTRLVHQDGRLQAVECCDKATGTKLRYRARIVVLAAGSLGSAHLLLASELDRVNPAGHLVGRNLMRHCNAVVFGVFPQRPNPRRQFHKQLGIHDFYFGHPSITEPHGKLGSIQQLQAPPVGLVRAQLPSPLRRPAARVAEHMTGLLVMAEDQPQLRNRVAVDWAVVDKFGLPQLTIEHRYSARDYAARKALVSKANLVLRGAGALVSYVHQIKTFSHAVGTTRFGADPSTSVLDPACRFRGIENLFVVDGSFMPTSAGLNPSLTISANALRVAEGIVQ